MNKKFQLFGQALFKKKFNKGKNSFIYYFTNKNNSFIFFPKDKKIFKLKYQEDINWDNLFYLEEYIEDKKVIEISYVKKIYSAAQYNTSIKIVNNQIKDYYLINKKWLDFKLEEYSKREKNNYEINLNEIISEKMVPNIIKNGIKNISYPKDFYFIEKKEYSSEILELVKIFQSEALPEYKIFFTYDDNLKKENKNIYAGLINNKDLNENESFIIYFYLVKNNNFEIEFIINYKDKERMNKEIKDNIIPNGVYVYLNIMTNIHENNNIVQKPLYDLDLNNIGFYINKLIF